MSTEYADIPKYTVEEPTEVISQDTTTSNRTTCNDYERIKAWADDVESGFMLPSEMIRARSDLDINQKRLPVFVKMTEDR